MSLWNSFRTPNETAMSEKAFSVLELWVVTSAKEGSHFCCCCVLAQDLSIFASLNVQTALTVDIKPLNALCAHPTNKKAALVDMKVTSIERKPCVRSYYCDCFCCEVVSANDWTNWKELLNLANFNLIG